MLASWPLALVLVSLLQLCAPASAIYFYMQNKHAKCFYEELPKDTLVVGHYMTETYNPHANAYVLDTRVVTKLSVVETFDNDHRVVNQRGAEKGRWSFTAADSGLHKLCFTAETDAPAPDGSSGWLSHGARHPVKMSVDMVVGESSKIESEDKSKMESISDRIKNLNHRLQEIRREQVFQREREADFRDQSESTNKKAVYWSIIQLVVLSATCAWQLSHLRTFFIKQKLT